TSSQLPPPGQSTMGAGGFPDAPLPGGEQVAGVDPSIQSGGAAAEITKNGLLGSWNVSSAGTSCQMFLTLTKYGSYSRGGTRGCANELSNMRAWELSGSQLLLYDDGGNAIARLYPTGGEQL